MIGQVGERRSPPQSHRAGQRVIGGSQVAGGEVRRLRDRGLERVGIQLARVDANGVAGCCANDALGAGAVAEKCPEARDVHAQQVASARGSDITPQLVDQPVVGDGGAGRGQQHREQGALGRCSQVEDAVPGSHAERAQDAELHGWSLRGGCLRAL